MDFVFTELMLWGRDHGYSWFSIGMAPLAGRCRGTLAPPWHGIGHLIYRHGENFYNFEGLRRVKEKLDPVWEYRYAAWPDGIPGLPRALLDSARLGWPRGALAGYDSSIAAGPANSRVSK